MIKNLLTLISKTLTSFPKLKKIINFLYDKIYGLPTVNNSEISENLIRNLVNKKNPIILEIGCNDGTHTNWIFNIFDQPKIYCFEPDPRAIKRFNDVVKNKTDIKLYQLALSNKNGEIDFYKSSGNNDGLTFQDGWDLSGSIRKPKYHLVLCPTVTFDNTIKVKSKTLDSWYEENEIEIIDFIWMDVQGAEIDIFSGGQHAISKTRYIYTEYSNIEMYEGQKNLKYIVNYLKEFEIVERYQSDVLLKNKLLQ
ncbi:MAG: FkbM family methyltransferase [Spirochaetota bacterium]|nr:FkbM family methyltransferase [Spirochaetota bacterium]